ncbi:ABC transporter substrate-binding protein [Alkalibacterium pelagium]|uniref:Putative aldouronate transport system substrate-binding protein n=1 Tax=Alkalibacterium pelagium TaxID=426702 RepID=A0A1H7IFP3_9LACT|nr:ABC transporter substrate-binding protein [Alkalibacterium pelagium]GEN50052.1 ABC transporter substrate-binding protein [Alkalibacterium pelagium]SEK60672.1 putative aldouronate transport system substrate-binding protein [Alkalibacterium pelagium]
MTIKKIVGSVVLTSALILSACGNGEGESTTDGGNNTSDNGNGSSEPITLTMFHADLAQSDGFDNPVAQEITERTGVQLDISYPVGGDDLEAIALMIGSGDFPDLIFGKGGLNQLIDSGGVLALDDLIEERGDNLKAMYGDQLDRLRNSLDDPSIYHVGTAGVENQVLETSGTMMLQTGMLRDLGYPEIKTLEDYENAIVEFLEENPTTEDGEEWYPMVLSGADWRWLITVGDPASFVSGFSGDGQWYVEEETGEATYKFQREEFREYFRWLNGMNAKGLLDPESFTHTHDTYISKLSSGRVLGIADQDWNIGSAEAALRAEGNEWGLWAPLPVTLNEDTAPLVTRDYGFTGSTGISISADSDHIDEAFDFLDWMASEEAQILTNWGVEGINYEIIDGKRVQLDEDRENAQTNSNYSFETGIGQYIHPFPQWGTAAVDSNGQSISRTTEEDIRTNFAESELETLEAYDANIWVDLFPAADELGIPNHGRAWEIPLPTGSQVNIIQQRADDYTTQKVTEAILTDPDNFDNVWDEMLAELESMNIDQANEEMSEIINRRIELWGGAE